MREGFARQLTAWAILDSKGRVGLVREESSLSPVRITLKAEGSCRHRKEKWSRDQRNKTRRTPHTFHCTPPVLRISRHFTSLTWGISVTEDSARSCPRSFTKAGERQGSCPQGPSILCHLIVGGEPRECVLNTKNSGFLWVSREVGSGMVT